MWTLLSLAAAAPVFGEPGEPVFLPVGGNWARAFPAAEGWTFLFAAGGEYNLLPMSDSFEVRDVNRVLLTGHTDLKDNQIVQCPDGTFFHAGSADLETQADTLYTFRYTADFVLTQTTTVADRDSTKRLNDPALACGGDGKTWIGAVDEHFSSILYEVPPDTSAPVLHEVPEFPFLQGGSLVYDPASDTLVAIGAGNGDPYYVRTAMDYVVGDKTSLGITPEGQRAYWPQAVLEVGDVYLLAFMARDDAQGWSVDTGDVWIAAFDHDWTLIETLQVTHATPPDGAMRPGLAVKGDQLLVLYDELTEMYLVPIPLWPDGTPTDSGTTDSGPGDSGDSGPTGGDDSATVDCCKPDAADPACGCSAPASGAGWAAALGALLLTATRRGGSGATRVRRYPSPSSQRRTMFRATRNR